MYVVSGLDWLMGWQVVGWLVGWLIPRWLGGWVALGLPGWLPGVPFGANDLHHRHQMRVTKGSTPNNTNYILFSSMTAIVLVKMDIYIHTRARV
jgi:hypothetical protein